MISLFNAASLTSVSPMFKLDAQVTVMAFGLTGTDVIQFEILDVLTSAAVVAPGSTCAPSGIAGTNQTIIASAPLSCRAKGPRVEITADHPSIIIDTPQGAWMRAVYTGAAGVGTFTASLSASNTTEISDAMRGCSCCGSSSVPVPFTLRGCSGNILVTGNLS